MAYFSDIYRFASSFFVTSIADPLTSATARFYPQTSTSIALSKTGCIIEPLPTDLHTSYSRALSDARHQVYSFYDSNKLSHFNLPLRSTRLRYFSYELLSFVAPSILGYLGPTAKLDSAYLACVTHNQYSNYSSGVLHHDSVGTRLKLYIHFFSFDSQIGTIPLLECLEYSHLSPHDCLENPVLDDGSRHDETSLREQYPSSFYTNDNRSFLLFDTNGYHRGCYEIGTSLRCDLVFEFSSFKSLFLRGYIGVSSVANLPKMYIPWSLRPSFLHSATQYINPYSNMPYVNY